MRETSFLLVKTLGLLALSLVQVESGSMAAGWQPPAPTAINRAPGAVPLIPENDCLWAEVRLNDKPTAMIVEPDLDIIVVSAAQAAELGLEPRGDSPRARFALADGVTVAARRTVVRAIVMGGYTARDLPCLVLDRSVGDMPPWLGLKALAPASWRVDPLKNQLLRETERGSTLSR